MPLNIGILASGNGTNAAQIIALAQGGKLDITVELVISNRPGAGVIKKAQEAGITCEVLDHKRYGSREEYDSLLAAKLAHCELIVLAGYMRILSAPFIHAFANRIINIHPALLPSFPGAHGARDALEYGVKLSGPTVHFVTEEMDNGPVIIQAATPVNAGESVDELLERIHALEHRIYPQAIQWIAEGRISVKGRSVHLAPGKGKVIVPDGNWFVWPPLEEGF